MVMHLTPRDALEPRPQDLATMSEDAILTESEVLLLAEDCFGQVPEWYQTNKSILASWRKEVESSTEALNAVLGPFRTRWFST
ncbi:hypothetical protein LJC09_01555 [Desulfovibrio sp. OttesenSCG-928-F20]|nr:hypothetical protein [Desulfovibrio sp. OttesenSCG-928-F20]